MMTKEECWQSAVTQMEDEGLLEPEGYLVGGIMKAAISAKPTHALAFVQLLGMRLFDAGYYDPIDLGMIPYSNDEVIVYMN